MTEDRQLAGFVVREVARQVRRLAGNDFARVESVTEEGRARLEVRPGKFIEVEPDSSRPASGSSINLNRGRGMLQADGTALYG